MQTKIALAFGVVLVSAWVYLFAVTPLPIVRAVAVVGILVCLVCIGFLARMLR